MRKWKIAVIAGLVFSFSAGGSTLAFAGQWQQDGTGWWYQNDDNTYPAGEWQWIPYGDEGNESCFYFDQNGYLLVDTLTPDGFQVNADGAWVQDGAVQQKAAETENEPEDEIYDEKEEWERAVEEAEEELYDAEGRSFKKKKEAVYGYLQALGFHTDGLTISSDSVNFSGFFSGTSALYDMLAYDSQRVLQEIANYMSDIGDAGDLIDAVEDYLY